MRRMTTAAATAAGTALAAALLAGCTSSADPGGAATTSALPTGVVTERATATPVPSTSSPAGPPAATASAVGTATLPPVRAGEPADFGDGLVARVTGITSQQLTAQGPGEISGPGVLVTISLLNGTSSPIDLNGLTVNASYGEGLVASPHLSPPAAPPTGRLAPGKSATGTWVFAVPADQASSLQVAISSISSPNAVVVTR